MSHQPLESDIVLIVWWISMNRLLTYQSQHTRIITQIHASPIIADAIMTENTCFMHDSV